MSNAKLKKSGNGISQGVSKINTLFIKMVDMNYSESWISQPDVCRCCLSASGTWDMTSSYITEAGIKEVYSEMLQECYGITLSCLLQWGPSRMVCGLCVGHLRDASNFRKQVVQAEQQFVTYCASIPCKQKPMVLNVKTSPDRECDKSEDYYNDETIDNIDILADSIEPNEIDRIPIHKSRPAKRKRTSSIDDMDSDTPISEILKRSTDTDVLDIKIEKTDDCLEQEEIENNELAPKGFLYTRRPNVAKQVSERKRVILTCAIVLRDTNACPFRHHKSWFQCFFCHEDFMEINLLRNHTLATHTNIDDELKKIKRYPRSLQIEISNLECRDCHFNLTDVISMRRHFEDVHQKVVYTECIADYKVNGSPYNCHLCNQQFHAFRSLTTHLNEHYANCICDVCGKSFLNSKRLKVHKRTHEKGQFPCTECGKILKTKTSKANHIESVHSKRIIKCQICFKPMKHYNDRIKHMSEVHNITHKFKCHICNREYNIKHYLATHIRQTHGHKNKKCLECGMAFITNHGLKKHMLKHSGIKPYSCNVCCKSYARSYSLREHMRAHDNEKFLPHE